MHPSSSPLGQPESANPADETPADVVDDGAGRVESARPPWAAAGGRNARPRHGLRTQLWALALAATIAIANVVLWRHLQAPVDAADYEGPIGGFAYNAFQRWDSPLENRFPDMKSVEADLALLSRQTRRIRTYSSSELTGLPDLAELYGLRVTAGVWLDPREDNNRKEMEAIKEATRRRGPIERVIAGNEQLLTAALRPEQLYAYLDELRRTVRVPVSTAEPWHVWLRYPELARHVDFITVHLLPYWEGVPADKALEYAIARYNEVKARFPNKHVLIGEIGWPSQGDRFDGSRASPENQAKFVREFLAYSRGRHLDYFLMEAIDQPWKVANEGRVGAYWGIYSADRVPKFDFAGPVDPDRNWGTKALLASALALLPMFWFLVAFNRMRTPSRLAFALFIQAAASLVIWLTAIPFDFYLRPVDWAALAVLLPTLLVMMAILLANGFEFAEMFWPGNLRRGFRPRSAMPSGAQPFVSVHLACCNEPPEMVIATIDSLRKLDYENFEVLVVDNNTRDEALWKPVERYMAGLGERFRFFHLPKWPGFKAGALNFALEQTDPRAEVIGVVDADYVVRRDWLSAMVGYFGDPKVAVAQAPQAHRAWNTQPLRRMMNFEYDGFFRIGMHHRNERDAIVQHGTMTLIRADALKSLGRWSQWCICEDTELGLRLMKAGLSTVYVDHAFGKGLTPDDFGAFKRQRRRWALGAMQIMKAHWRSMLRKGELTPAQRYHFVAGWLPWVGDALHLVFAFAAMLWTIGIVAAPHLFSLPVMLFMIPLFGFFGAKAAFGPLLYLRRVECSKGDVAGAALAGMGLSHAIALGVFAGLTQRTGVFEVTKKGTMNGAPLSSDGAAAVPATAWTRLRTFLAQRFAGFAPVREEAMLLLGLATCFVAMMVSRKSNHVESAMWMGILVLQAVPYAAALACAWLSNWPEKKAAAGARAEPRLAPVALEPGPLERVRTGGLLAQPADLQVHPMMRNAIDRGSGVGR